VQPFSRFSVLALVIIAMAARCGACTIVYPTFHVGQNFRVKVEDRGHPVKGLQVEIRRDQVSNRAFTDKDGLAFFHGIQPGHY